MVLGKKENTLVLSILFILATLITYVDYSKGNFNSPHMGDSAFLLETTENISKNNNSKSYAFGAFVQYHFQGVGSKKSEDFTFQDFQLVNGDEAFSTFSNHSYYILYAIAQFGKIFDIEKMFYTIHVFSFFILLYFTYKILRENSVEILPTTLFIVLLFIHPAFSLSMSGQFYVERFILPFAMMLLYYIQKEKTDIYILYILAIIICSITERAPLYTGIFLVMYIILFWKNILPRKRLHLTLLTILLFIYSFWAMHNIKTMMAGQISSFLPTSFGELALRMSNSTFTDNLYIYLLFTILFLGIFTLINWRYILILIVMLIPNAVGNIGGAEKYGYLTHYHSLYFPFIVFLSALGYSSIVSKLKNKHYQKVAFFILMFFLILASAFYSPYSRDFKISNAINENTLFKDFHLYKELFDKNSLTREYIDNYHKIDEIIPKKSVVVSSEFIINILWKDRIHYMFPMGIDKADYAVLYAVKDGNEYKYSGFTSYILSPDEVKKVDEMVIERMHTLGYDFENQVILNNYAIIKRKQ